MNDAQPSKIAVLGPGGVGRLLVPLLNGVEHPVLLRRRYRPEQVMAGVIRVEYGGVRVVALQALRDYRQA